MLIANVMHVMQPVIGKTQALVKQRRPDSAAAIVTDHHDVLHLQNVNGVLYNREAVQIGMHHDIGDVALYKHLARHEPHDFVCRYATVGTPDPQEPRILLLRKLLKEVRLLRANSLRPVDIVLEQCLKVFILQGHGLLYLLAGVVCRIKVGIRDVRTVAAIITKQRI